MKPNEETHIVKLCDICGLPLRTSNIGWAEETMAMINKITPDIKEKAFDPDWFLLRQRLDEAGRLMDAVKISIHSGLFCGGHIIQ